MIALYHSGTPANHRYQDIENSLCTHRLFSLHGNYHKAVIKWVKDLSRDYKYPKNIMLDSGAFTAWNKGDEVSISDVQHSYDTFLDQAGDLFDEVWMINLDKIPGEVGRDPTLTELQEAIAISDRNYDILSKRYGSCVLPVFHQGENWQRLETVLTQNKYVCLSPRNDLHEAVRIAWSRDLHERVPAVKSHGLAATGVYMMNTVPWFSVDSAAWRLRAAYGMVIFHLGNSYRSIFFAHEGGKHKFWDNHFDTLAPLYQDIICERITKYPFSVDQLKTDALARAVVSMGELQSFVETVRPKNSGLIQETLFDA